MGAPNLLLATNHWAMSRRGGMYYIGGEGGDGAAVAAAMNCKGDVGRWRGARPMPVRYVEALGGVSEN